MEEITGAGIRAAAERIAGLVHRTPVATSRSFDAAAGCRAYLKCENFQRGGAFKIRGAANFLYSLPEEQRGHGVVAYSSGNHAQAVAIAARAVGARATLVMPRDAPRSKVEGTRAQGAEIVLYDRGTESREGIARGIAEERGATLVPPFDHPWIIAGQGTCALELLEQAPGIEALIAPVSGGGLLAGSAIAARSVNPQMRIFGAEPELGNDVQLSLRAGRRIEIATPATIADGLRVTSPGELTFPILQQLAEDVLLVSEQEIKEAIKFLLARVKILVEPSGAASAAAVLFGKLPKEVKSVGVILSGGNMDLELLREI